MELRRAPILCNHFDQKKGSLFIFWSLHLVLVSFSFIASPYSPSILEFSFLNFCRTHQFAIFTYKFLSWSSRASRFVHHFSFLFWAHSILAGALASHGPSSVFLSMSNNTFYSPILYICLWFVTFLSIVIYLLYMFLWVHWTSHKTHLLTGTRRSFLAVVHLLYNSHLVFCFVKGSLDF